MRLWRRVTIRILDVLGSLFLWLGRVRPTPAPRAGCLGVRRGFAIALLAVFGAILWFAFSTVQEAMGLHFESRTAVTAADLGLFCAEAHVRIPPSAEARGFFAMSHWLGALDAVKLVVPTQDVPLIVADDPARIREAGVPQGWQDEESMWRGDLRACDWWDMPIGVPRAMTVWHLKNESSALIATEFEGAQPGMTALYLVWQFDR